MLFLQCLNEAHIALMWQKEIAFNICIHAFSFLLTEKLWTSIKQRQTVTTHNANWLCYRFLQDELCWNSRMLNCFERRKLKTRYFDTILIRVLWLLLFPCSFHKTLQEWSVFIHQCVWWAFSKRSFEEKLMPTFWHNSCSAFCFSPVLIMWHFELEKNDYKVSISMRYLLSLFYFYASQMNKNFSLGNGKCDTCLHTLQSDVNMRETSKEFKSCNIVSAVCS